MYASIPVIIEINSNDSNDHTVSVASLLGGVVVAWGVYFIVGYLDP